MSSRATTRDLSWKPQSQFGATDFTFKGIKRIIVCTGISLMRGDELCIMAAGSQIFVRCFIVEDSTCKLFYPESAKILHVGMEICESAAEVHRI